SRPRAIARTAATLTAANAGTATVIATAAAIGATKRQTTGPKTPRPRRRRSHAANRLRKMPAPRPAANHARLAQQRPTVPPRPPRTAKAAAPAVAAVIAEDVAATAAMKARSIALSW